MPHHALFARRMLPRAALLLFLLPLGAGCGSKIQNAIKVQETLAEAYRHAQVDTDDVEARRWADKAIALAPNAPSTYLGDPSATVPGPQIGVATVFQAVGDDVALADYMTQAVQKFPTDARGYQTLIEAQDRLGRAAQRRATASALVSLLTKKLQAPGAQNIPTLTAALGQAYFAAGDPVNGAAQYHKVIAAYPSLTSYPNDLGPYNGLAYGYAEANSSLPEALGLAQKALALARKSNENEEAVAAVQDTLGWVQYRMGDTKDAEQNLLEAAGAAPRQPEVRFHLGTVYAAEGKTDAARAELGHAVLLSPGYAAAHLALDTLNRPTKAASS